MWDRFVWWLARKMFPISPLNDGWREPLSLENYETQRRRLLGHPIGFTRGAR